MWWRWMQSLEKFGPCPFNQPLWTKFTINICSQFTFLLICSLQNMHFYGFLMILGTQCQKKDRGGVPVEVELGLAVSRGRSSKPGGRRPPPWLVEEPDTTLGSCRQPVSSSDRHASRTPRTPRTRWWTPRTPWTPAAHRQHRHQLACIPIPQTGKHPAHQKQKKGLHPLEKGQ